MANISPVPSPRSPQQRMPRRSSLRCGPASATMTSNGHNGGSNQQSTPAIRPHGRKSVSFATFGVDRKARTVGECVDQLRNGIALLKIKPNGRVYRRLFFIDDLAMELRWSPTKKSKAKLPLSSVREICVGRSTDSLRSNATAMTYNDSQFFSIVHGAELNCLDLIASSPEDAATCVTALRSIIASIARRTSTVSVVSNSSLQGESASVSSMTITTEPSAVRIGWLSSLCTGQAPRLSVGSSVNGPVDVIPGADDQRSEQDAVSEPSNSDAAAQCQPVVRPESCDSSNSSAANTANQVQRPSIARDQVLSLIQQINPASSMVYAELRLKELLHGRSEITFSEFVQIVDEVAIWQEVHFLLVNQSSIGGGEFMALDDIQRFLECEQAEPCPAEALSHGIIDRFEPNPLAKVSNLLGCEGFLHYLLSEEGSAFAKVPASSQLATDFASEPFTNYYVFAFSRCFGSSDCGLDPIEHYVSVLRSGCKYVELCLHDYSGSDVCVCHAASGRAPLSSALTAIARHAFSRSRYPLIIHVSAFCTPDAQRRAANQIRTAFGALITIVRPSPPSSDPSKVSETTSGNISVMHGTPTLADLEGRIIFTSDNADSSDVVSAAPHLGASPRSLVADLAELVSYQFIFCTPAGGNGRSLSGVTNNGTSPIPLALIDSCGPDFASFRQCVCSSGMIAAAAQTSLIRVTLLDSPALMAATNRLAIDTSSCAGAISSPPTSPIDSALSANTTHHHTVVPFHYWLTGCQIVAGPARPTSLIRQVAAALFADPSAPADTVKKETWASVGYMKRPPVVSSLLPIGVDRLAFDLYPGWPPQILNIEVLAAHNLPRPSRSDAVKADSVDPYVVVEVHSVPMDTARGRTRTQRGDSFGPIFSGDKFEFSVRLPQLAVLRFAILDDEFIGDDFIAHTALPVSSLRRGYRSLPLFSAEGRRIPSGWLLVRIGVSSPPIPLDLFISQPVQQRKPQAGSRVSTGSAASGGQQQLAGKLRLVGIREADDLVRGAASILTDSRSIHERAATSFTTARSLLGLPRDASLTRCFTVLMSHDVAITLNTSNAMSTTADWNSLRFEPASSLAASSGTGASLSGSGGSGNQSSGSQPTDAVRRLVSAFRILIEDLDAAVRLSPDITRRLAIESSQQIAVASALPSESQAADTLLHNAALLSTESHIADSLARNCQEMLTGAVTHIRHCTSTTGVTPTSSSITTTTSQQR